MGAGGGGGGLEAGSGGGVLDFLNRRGLQGAVKLNAI